MSSKKNITLLIPGGDSWERWTGDPSEGLQKAHDAGSGEASDLSDHAADGCIMAFPCRDVLAVPFNVKTKDESMFGDLAAMHLEKAGVRLDPDAGQLTDVFSASQTNGQTTLLSVVVSAPDPEGMPFRSPKGFDLSARCFSFRENAITLWRELGRWVFAVSSGGELIYFQALSGGVLDVDAVRDMRLALAQLSLQGIDPDVQQTVMWRAGQGSDPSEEVVRSFAAELGAEVVFEDKPGARLPDPLSSIMPADVRAEQRFRKEKKKRNLVIGCLVIAYFVTVAWLAYDYHQMGSRLAAQQEQLDKARLEHREIGLFNADWDQLAPVVDSRRWPLQLLHRAATVIPRGQHLRFELFQASRDEIDIKGEAAKLNVANEYAEKLRRELPEYDWELPPAQPDNKTNFHKFVFKGILKNQND